MANPVMKLPDKAYYDERESKLKELGIEPNIDNYIKYDLLFDSNLPIEKNSFTQSIEQVYESAFGKRTAPPFKKPEPDTVDPKPNTLPGPPPGEALSVTGKSSVIGDAANRVAGAWGELEKQISLAPEQRTGAAGVLASLLPQRYPVTEDVKNTGKPLIEPATESELMYLARVLNIPSSAVSALGETLYERAAGSGEQNSLSSEMGANFARAQAKGEGIAEFVEKAAKKAEDVVENTTGIRPEWKPFGENWGPDIGIDPSNMAWYWGLGLDFLTPSTGEILSIGKQLPDAVVAKINEAPKPAPIDESTLVDEAAIKNAPGESRVFPEVEWYSERNVDSIGETPEKRKQFTDTPGARQPAPRTQDALLTTGTVTAEMFAEGKRVIHVDNMPGQGKNVLGVEYILDDVTQKPVPSRILTRIEDAPALQKKLGMEPEPVGWQLDSIPPNKQVKPAQLEGNPATKSLPLQEGINTRASKQLETQTRQQLTPQIIANKKRRLSIQEKQRLDKLSEEHNADIFGFGKGNDKSVPAAELTKANDYKSRLESIEDRWKYHIKQDDMDGAFRETAAKLGDDVANDVYDASFLDAIVEPVRKGNYLIDGRALGPILHNKVAKALSDRLDRILYPGGRPKFGIQDTAPIEPRTPEFFTRKYEQINEYLNSNPTIKIDGEDVQLEITSKIPDINESLTRTWYEASGEAVAKAMLDDMDVRVPRGAVSKGDAGVLLNLGLDPDKIVRIASDNISASKADFGYKDFTDAVTVEYNKGRPPEYHVSPDHIYEQFIQSRVLFDAMRDLNRNVDELVMWEMVRRTLGSRSYRERLASAISTDPSLSELFGKMPQKVREARSRTLVDTIAADLGKNPEDLPWIARLLGNLLEGHGSFLRNQILGGGLLPNFRYLTMNFLGNPFIIYQQLGLRPTLGMLANLPTTSRLVMDLSRYENIPGVGRFIPSTIHDGTIIVKPNAAHPKGITYKQLRDIALDRGITKGQTSFEMSGDVLKSMQEFVEQNTSPSFWKSFKKYVGVSNNPSTWNSLANDVDVMYRSGVLIDSLQQGDTIETAVRKARESLFDYGSLTDFEKNYVAKLVFFYSFQRHNLVRVFKSLMTGKGQTRIKNLLMLVHQEPDPGEGVSDFGETKPRIMTKPTDEWALYGPEIPAASAIKLMGEAAAFFYWLAPRAMGGGGSPQKAGSGALDFAAKQGVNPYLETFVEVLSQGKWDLRNRRTQGNGPDQRIVGFWEATGLMPHAEKLFELVPDRENRYREGSFNEDPTKRLDYKFATENGRFNYAIWQKLVFDLIAGQGRTARDWEYFIDPRYPIEVNIPTGLGAVTPYRKERLLDQRIRTNMKKLK